MLKDKLQKQAVLELASVVLSQKRPEKNGPRHSYWGGIS
jgi:hypothetical protein